MAAQHGQGMHGGFNAPTSVDISKVVGHAEFMRNPARWVHDVLTPLLEQKFGSLATPELAEAIGTEGWKVKSWDDIKQNMPNREALENATAFIGKMFGDRNAMKAIIEMSQMWPKLSKDADQMLEMIKRYQEFGTLYRQGSFDYQVQSVHMQLRNLLQLFGSAQSGTAVLLLTKLNAALGELVQWASGGDRLDAKDLMSGGSLGMLSQGLVALAAGLGALAAVAIVGLVGTTGAIITLVGALTALVAINWGAITSGIKSFMDSLKSLFQAPPGAPSSPYYNMTPGSYTPPARPSGSGIQKVNLYMDGRLVGEVSLPRRHGGYSAPAPAAFDSVMAQAWVTGTA
jgi:hypothetical protein